MGDKSNISWTDATWNVFTGCSVVSPGCTHCYAMQLAGTRLADVPAYKGLTREVNGHHVWTGEVRFHEHLLDKPLHRKKPRLIFTNSMSDMFHESISFETLDRVFDVMERANWHVFQVLTKRPARMLEYMQTRIASYALEKGFTAKYPGYGESRYVEDNPHIWMGTSVEDQRRVNERIPFLVQVPAAIRFLSAEPLLGKIDLTQWMPPGRCRWQCSGCRAFFSGELRETCPSCLRIGYWSGSHSGNSRTNGQPLSWVIVGGESGPGYRSMDVGSATALQEQCEKSAVAFFFKQDSGARSGLRDDLLGRKYHEYPAMLSTPEPEQKGLFA